MIAEIIFLFFLWWIVNLIWPNKKGRGRRDRGDNYIILSELEHDHGHDDGDDVDSIYHGDGDSDY